MKITRRQLRNLIREETHAVQQPYQTVMQIYEKIDNDIEMLIKGDPSAPNETRISNRHMNKTQARILEGVLDYYMSLERYRYAAIVDLINASIQMEEEGQWDIRDAVNLVSDEDLGDATRAFKTYMVHPHVSQNIPVSGGSFLSRLSDVPDPEGLEDIYNVSTEETIQESSMGQISDLSDHESEMYPKVVKSVEWVINDVGLDIDNVQDLIYLVKKYRDAYNWASQEGRPSVDIIALRLEDLLDKDRHERIMGRYNRPHDTEMHDVMVDVEIGHGDQDGDGIKDFADSDPKGRSKSHDTHIKETKITRQELRRLVVEEIKTLKEGPQSREAEREQALDLWNRRSEFLINRYKGIAKTLMYSMFGPGTDESNVNRILKQVMGNYSLGGTALFQAMVRVKSLLVAYNRLTGQPRLMRDLAGDFDLDDLDASDINVEKFVNFVRMHRISPDPEEVSEFSEFGSTSSGSPFSSGWAWYD